MIGKQIDGIWHTGIVVYGKEFYFGGGISYDLPACTPFGKHDILTNFRDRLTNQENRTR
jgi:hypothetical protein